MKDGPDDSFSMAYIETSEDVVAMPDTIKILLLWEQDDKILSETVLLI